MFENGCCGSPSDRGKIEEKNGSETSGTVFEEGEEAHMLRGEKIVFTGKLDTLSRKQAQDLVSALGGKPQAAVTKDTTILVVGKANTNLFQEDPRSLKMQKVEALQQDGHSVCVLSEQAFLEKALLHLNQVVGIMKGHRG